jgi:hypothetical protein
MILKKKEMKMHLNMVANVCTFVQHAKNAQIVIEFQHAPVNILLGIITEAPNAKVETTLACRAKLLIQK